MRLALLNSVAAIAILGICGAAESRADVTIRYEAGFDPAPALQPLLQPFMAKIKNPAVTSVQIKGNLGYTSSGNFQQILNFAKGEATLLDPEHKTYATVGIKDLMDKLAGALTQQSGQQAAAMNEAFSAIKSHVESRLTGKSETIQGVEAEEREIVFTMDIPLPPGMANDSGPSVKMVVDMWSAKKEEALRVPAIRELSGYYEYQKYLMNPAGMLEKVAGQMPALASAFGSLFDEMFKSQGVILRNRTDIYVPFLANLQKQMAAKGQSFPELDPNAPLLTMKQEVAELSSAPVDATLLTVPKDYNSVPVEDLVRAMITTPAIAPGK